MLNAKDKESIELKLSNTTITIKRGIKKQLDDLGRRKESYNDIIRKLISDNKILINKLNKIKSNDTLPVNKLTLRDLKRKKSYFNYKGEIIRYSYNMPNRPLSGFIFDIHIDDYKKVELIKSDTNYPTIFYLYLLIVEKLLRQYIDPLFKINKKRLLDLVWWQNQLVNLGFDEETYQDDIENKLTEFGVMP